MVEMMRWEVLTTGFLTRSVAGSALIEEDPARASAELRLLSPIREATLENVTRSKRQSKVRDVETVYEHRDPSLNERVERLEKTVEELRAELRHVL